MEFLPCEEEDVLNPWVQAQRDMENKRMGPLLGGLRISANMG